MSTAVGIGTSTNLDSFSAGKEAAKHAFYQLGRDYPDIIIAFISPIFNQAEAIRGIRSIITGTPLIGCSSAGTISSSGSFKNSITVCVISSTSIIFSYGLGEGVSKNPRSAGNKAARDSRGPKDLTNQAYIMFSDSLSGNMTDVLRGTQEVRGTSFTIIGGSATDDFRFQHAYQYLNSIYTDSIVGLLISGDISVTTGIAHGWQPIGRPHKITRSKSNVIREIDRKRAVELYEGYLDKTPDELKIEGIAKLGSTYPLGMRIGGVNQYIARTPLKINDDGSLMLSAEISEREDINLMIGDKNLALDAAKEACKEALRNVDRSGIRFAIVFSDIARLQLLGKDSQKEVEIIKHELGPNVPFFGCYTCGEYAPVNIPGYGGQSYFQNQAIAVSLFS